MFEAVRIKPLESPVFDAQRLDETRRASPSR